MKKLTIYLSLCIVAAALGQNLFAQTGQAGTDSLSATRKVTDEIKEKNALGVYYTPEVFSKRFGVAHRLTLQASRSSAFGVGLIRLNYMERLKIDGYQLEADMYPKINRNVYLYANYGFSSSALFPGHRFGTEIYATYLRSMESSVGLRYMRFQNSDVMVYTGSLGLYYRDYWFSLRPYIGISDNSANNASALVSARRYFKDNGNYIGVNAGLGYSPDFSAIQSSVGLTDNEVQSLNSVRYSATFQKSVRRWIVNVSCEVTHQSLDAGQDKDLMIFSSTLGIRTKF